VRLPVLVASHGEREVRAGAVFGRDAPNAWRHGRSRRRSDRQHAALGLLRSSQAGEVGHWRRGRDVEPDAQDRGSLGSRSAQLISRRNFIADAHQVFCPAGTHRLVRSMRNRGWRWPELPGKPKMFRTLPPPSCPVLTEWKIVQTTQRRSESIHSAAAVSWIATPHSVGRLPCLTWPCGQ